MSLLVNAEEKWINYFVIPKQFVLYRNKECCGNNVKGKKRGGHGGPSIPNLSRLRCWAPSGAQTNNAHALVLKMATSYEGRTTCVKLHYTRNDTGSRGQTGVSACTIYRALIKS